MRVSILSVGFLFPSVYQPVASWGDVGHRTVAYLAERFFTEHGAQLANDLLTNNQGFDISDASVWADTVKQKRPYTRPWHYIGSYLPTQVYYMRDSHVRFLDAEDRPPTSCSVSYQDDCDDAGCIVSAMENMVCLGPLKSSCARFHLATRRT
jgi:hypothetical protein